MAAKLFENSALLNKTVGAVKNVSNTFKATTQQAPSQVWQLFKSVSLFKKHNCKLK